jgi:hypothetical protein
VSWPAAASFRQWEFLAARPRPALLTVLQNDAQRSPALLMVGITAATDGVIEDIVAEIADFSTT